MPQPVVIVMVEDDPGHARLIQKNFRRAGVANEIILLTDGASAIAYLFGADGTGQVNAGRPLLLLLDLNLPDMSGTEILRLMKKNEHLKAIPVVVLTTTEDPSEIRNCYDLGCSVYVTKPVNYEKFAHAMQNLGLFVSVIQVPTSLSPQAAL